jgi:hypothetical protein
MRAHGSDKLRVAGEKLILSCRLPKTNWRPRTPKTLVHSEYPGTAVLWDEQFFEVVEARQLANGVEYTLEPWKDVHVIRASDRYDAESEQHRIASYQVEIKRRSQRRITLLLGMFAGHLPTGVQERLGNELGLDPARLTLMSTIPAWIASGICAYLAADARLNKEPNPTPLVIGLLVAIAAMDAAVRAYVYFTQSRPIGSPFGLVAYAIYYYVFARDRSGLLKPGDEGRGHRTFTLPPPDGVQLQDDLTTYGPLLSLLTPAEQKRMAALGYDYRAHAKGLAWILLVGCAIGAFTSFAAFREHGRVSALLSMLVAGGLALEQVVRLKALSSGPAGSVLGVLARPFVRKLLRQG